MKRQYHVFDTEALMNALPYSDRFKGLIAYVKETDKYYRLSSNLDVFNKLLSEKGQMFTASDFINLTLYHSIGTENVMVICKDKLTGDFLDISWKTGNGVRSNAMADSAVTIMSDLPVKREIQIFITQIQ